ncbi:hypothetical protein ES703_57709 [subsurface metagenome]
MYLSPPILQLDLCILKAFYQIDQEMLFDYNVVRSSITRIRRRRGGNQRRNQQLIGKPSGLFSARKTFNVLQGLMTKIGIVQLGIITTLTQKAFVASFFDDSSMIHNNNPVGMLDCG